MGKMVITGHKDRVAMWDFNNPCSKPLRVISVRGFVQKTVISNHVAYFGL